jgi:hypothetical protein
MIPFNRVILFSLLAVCLTGQAWAAPLTMTLATQQRLGIVTSQLVSMRHGDTVRGYARVLDPLPLASLDADIMAAKAVAQASRGEAERTKMLNAAGAAVSVRAAEAAQAQARVDQAHLIFLRRQLALQWGPIATLSDDRRSALVSQISTGRAALVRIDSPATAAQVGLTALEVSFEGLGTAHVTLLGPARTADVRMGSVGLMGQVTGPLAARMAVGLTAPVTLPLRGAGSGVVVPRSALLRTGGQTWAYVKLSPTTFERRVLVGAHATEMGMGVSKGFSEGESVVIQGGTMLLSAETARATPPSRDD